MSDKPTNTPKVEAKPELSDAYKQALKDVSEQLIPAAIAAVMTAQKGQAPAERPRAHAPMAAPRCHECGQQKTACEGKHVKLVVFPIQYPQHADFFPGVFINGVRYLSNDGGHAITVPEVSANEIAAIVRGFEKNEQEMAVGRKAERHSGVVSPHGSATVPQTVGWR